MPTCRHCIHSLFDQTQWYAALMSGWATPPLCSNHPDSPGQIRRIPAGGPCRNFRARRQEPLRLKPPKPLNDEIRYIALTKGKFATVDAADYERLSRFRWHAKETRGRFYAATVIKGKSIAMHQMLMAPPPGMIVDHINGQGLDNRRDNLRLCTPQQNRHNTRSRRGSSRYIGVQRTGRKYRARIKQNGQEYFLGSFDSEIEAAKTRDQKAKELQGPFAWLNFPEKSPNP